MFSGWQYLTTWEQLKWVLLLIGQILFGLAFLACMGLMATTRGGESCGAGIVAVVCGTIAGLCWKAGVAIVATAAWLAQ